ncbi:MAG: adenosylcobinamide-GDP ribazoletransferase [Opitutaceae bacterium]|jgi:adenosylcobinamide-GDP ribazoletransferase
MTDEPASRPSELRTLAAALMFFTRLPLVGRVRIDGTHLRGAILWFPVAGWCVGGLAAAVWWAAAQVWPADVAAGLSIVATLLLTGALHEDGWADVCDGFGGGHTRDKTLAIMKDSHIGAYGVIGLVVMLGLKWRLLTSLPFEYAPAAMIAAHSLSRAAAGSLMATLDYARAEDEPSKARPLVGRIPAGRLVGMLVMGVAPLVILPARAAWAIAVVVAVRWMLARWFEKRIGGYTGDCLGAAQQVGEVAVLLTLLAVL